MSSFLTRRTTATGFDRRADGMAAVPVDVDGQRVYVWVEEELAGADDEQEIAFRKPSLDQALDGVMGVVRAMGGRLQSTNATKVSVEFACEFAVESGAFVAVIGKASGKSTFKVALEWTKPAP
jgi:hypothetical protein